MVGSDFKQSGNNITIFVNEFLGGRYMLYKKNIACNLTYVSFKPHRQFDCLIVSEGTRDSTRDRQYNNTDN